jgi:hypothetical protein
MRRLNVRLAQIDECIRSSMFALSARPSNPELIPGELLLLQLVKQEAVRAEKLHSRIDFALVFERLLPDFDGTISRMHWPYEGRTWKWIVYGHMTVPTIPFSLEDLSLSRGYDGQDNARLISPVDEERVKPFIQWSLAQTPRPELQLVPAGRISEKFDRRRVLQALYNHDRIAAVQGRVAGTNVAEHAPQYSFAGEGEDALARFLVDETRYRRNPALADTLKSYYRYRCQVCGNDFEPRYGESLAESHHVQYLSRGGLDVSGNIIVLCPNHHRIIHATDARFNRRELAYEFPNGLRERLLMSEHLEHQPMLHAPTS